MIKKQSGRISLEVKTDKTGRDAGCWLFSENGWQQVGVQIPVGLFDLMRDMVTNPHVVEYYESIRGAEPTIFDK